MDLVFDIETDDLQATLVHCIVAQDAETGEIFKFPPHKLEEGYKFLATADRLIGHNIIGFDIPMVQKFRVSITSLLLRSTPPNFCTIGISNPMMLCPISLSAVARNLYPSSNL